MTPGMRADGSIIQAVCNTLCVLVVVGSQDAQQGLQCEQRPGKRGPVTEKEIDLMLYKVEGKLSTIIWVSRTSRVLVVGGGLPSD